jgi:hypothetical protein
VLDVKKVLEIVERGNTAEVKKTKNGITVLEVKRKIKYRENDEQINENLDDTHKQV